MRKLMIVTAAIVAAVLFLVIATLPPAPRRATWAGEPGVVERTVHGAYHVHTSRSDGAGDRAEVARAAARAGLRFVVITDHGDGTRAAEAPAYVDGVLVVEGVEISSNGGHYVALGLPGATPYPLGGEASAVVEDVRRFGGFGFAAHVDSVRPELTWRDWGSPFDGLEWLNADSEWRNESGWELAGALTSYLVRPGPALARMLDRPTQTLARWDELAATRRVLALAGHDAHGGVAAREEGRGGAIAGMPSYEASFRSFTTGAILDRAFSGDASRDAQSLFAAIRAGRTFTTLAAVAAPGLVDLEVHVDGARIPMGSTTPPGRPARLRAVASLPPGAQMAIVRNGRDIATTSSGRYEAQIDGERGSVRVEVRVAGTSRAPWLATNPVYFVSAPPTPSSPTAIATTRLPLSWHVEKDPGSSATFQSQGGGAAMSFALRPGKRESQYVALVADLPAQHGTAFDCVRFASHSDRPARVSVQLRYADGLRWGRSAVMDAETAVSTVCVSDMVPADRQAHIPPDTAEARWLLFVVDLTNMAPGGEGTFAIQDVTFLRTSRGAR